MLIKFSVQNYLSFKELSSLEMLPASIKQHEENILSCANYKLLKSAAIFGANASGKSNLFKAMSFAKNFILNSSKDMQANENIPITPFLLSDTTDKEPSLFEFIFLKNNIKYRYGFRVTQDKVVDEWLFTASKNKESLLFNRHLQEFNLSSKFKEGRNLKILTRENALFLSVVAQFNGEISQLILDWFTKINIISGFSEYSGVTLNYLNNLNDRNEFINIFKIADFTIEDFKIEERDISEEPKFIQERVARAKETCKNFRLRPKIKTIHNKYDINYNLIDNVEFDFKQNESKGTQNLFSILGPILDTIQNGKILIIDELECNLHPLLSRFLVKMFHLKNKSAQFIFNTHDTNLLNNRYFRRDQIYFIDKTKYGESNLYSLYDYNIRSDRTFDKDYLEGKFKAVPFIDEYGILGNQLKYDCEEVQDGDR